MGDCGIQMQTFACRVKKTCTKLLTRIGGMASNSITNFSKEKVMEKRIENASFPFMKEGGRTVPNGVRLVTLAQYIDENLGEWKNRLRRHRGDIDKVIREMWVEYYTTKEEIEWQLNMESVEEDEVECPYCRGRSSVSGHCAWCE
jgi:hypothetical protein